MNKKITNPLVCIGVVLVLLASAGLGDCAPSPPPTPTPTPKPQVAVNFFGGKAGSFGYVFAYAVSDLVNKNSSWLRGNLVETAGSIENIQTIVTDPTKRKTSAFWSNTYSEYNVKKGDPPFNKPYTTIKIVSGVGNNPIWIATLDPKIKTGRDLIGKRFAIGAPGIGVYPMAEQLLKYGWGIFDQVKIEPLGFNDGKDALINRLIDATLQGCTVIGAGETPQKPKTIATNPAGKELIQRAKPYVVDIDQASLEKARKATGYPIFWTQAAPQTFGPNQPEPVGTCGYQMTWSVDSEMPDDVAYEITRIMYENTDKFGGYHVAGKSVTKQGMAMVPGTTENDFHPGAVKFYKEHGIKIGG